MITAKQTENRIVKSRMTTAGFTDIKVGHSSHGWLDIGVSIAKPTDCFCSEVSRNMGRCKNCSDAWYGAYTFIKQDAKEATGRTGEYDGYIQVKVGLI